MSLPKLAIVGHPNRGKSSLVATLVEDERIAISPVSGTTEVAEPFTLTIANHPYIEIIDTPGFQRARRLLAQLGGESLPLQERPAAIKWFLSDVALTKLFPDEAALLAPIVNGAGVLYVVDGGRPYEPIYEAEMEILRWTGAARMAVINPIGGQDYVGQWQEVLSQQFQVVREFNPLTSSFDMRLDLLNAFSILAPSWQSSLSDLQQQLQAIRLSRREEVAGHIGKLLNKVLSHKVSLIGNSQKAREVAQFKLLNDIKQSEQSCWQNMLSTYRFDLSDLAAKGLDLPEGDLFNQSAWQMWGLSRKQLMLAVGASGALAGGAIDLAVGGSSLFVGTVAGASVASASAWLADKKIKQHGWARALLAQKESWQCGPVSHHNFGFVVLARALALWFVVEQRTHAQRDDVVMPDMQSTLWHQLSLKQQGQRLKTFKQIQKGPLNNEELAKLTQNVIALFEQFYQQEANA